MKNLFGKIPVFFKNKYVITLLGFVIWMMFIDQYDIISQIKLYRKLRQMKEDKAYYEREIEKTNNELESLLSDNDKLERFAREKYLMKKDNEDIFVIVKE